jgi:hypothetical protein
LADDGFFVFSYICAADTAGPPPDGWHYPGCVGYAEQDLNRLLAEAQLQGCALPWFHPGAAWHMAVKAGADLPSADDLSVLTGKILRAR